MDDIDVFIIYVVPYYSALNLKVFYSIEDAHNGIPYIYNNSNKMMKNLSMEINVISRNMSPGWIQKDYEVIEKHSQPDNGRDHIYLRYKDDYLYEEERRLFYVALTRTRTKCMLLVPIDYPSIFINEVFEISHETIERYIIEDDIKLHNPTCPRCGTGILVAYKSNFDSSNFVGCSNYPKCDFKYKTDEIIKNTIKCPRCGSYMVRRSGMYGTFYGCINYPFCTQTININSDFDDF